MRGLAKLNTILVLAVAATGAAGCMAARYGLPAIKRAHRARGSRSEVLAGRKHLRIYHVDGVKNTHLRLRGANLSRANLQDSLLARADLTDACLADAWLSGANLGYADLTGACLKRALLRFCDLKGAGLEGADLTDADLRGANFEGATYNRATRWPSGFDPQGHGAVLVE